ncbi:hypothetical protein [Nocardia sp. NPDC003963]
MTNRTFLSPEDAARIQAGIRDLNARMDQFREAAIRFNPAAQPIMRKMARDVEEAFAPAVEALRKTGGPKA